MSVTWRACCRARSSPTLPTSRATSIACSCVRVSSVSRSSIALLLCMNASIKNIRCKETLRSPVKPEVAQTQQLSDRNQPGLCSFRRREPRFSLKEEIRVQNDNDGSLCAADGGLAAGLCAELVDEHGDPAGEGHRDPTAARPDPRHPDGRLDSL